MRTRTGTVHRNRHAAAGTLTGETLPVHPQYEEKTRAASEKPAGRGDDPSASPHIAMSQKELISYIAPVHMTTRPGRAKKAGRVNHLTRPASELRCPPGNPINRAQIRRLPRPI